MTAKLRSIVERLRSHILFVPGVMAAAAILLAVGLVELDRNVDPEIVRRIPWVFRAGASGAREVLTTVATAMVQFAAITFSVTIVALALRSQQFGPRLLRNFTTDQVNQAILGAFIATFVYCLLVLRAVRDVEDEAVEVETFIPFVSVTVAIVLALLTLALFVVFIDRVMTSIQASSIIAEAAEETRGAIDGRFPEMIGEGAEPDAVEEPPSFDDGAPVMAGQTGYIQIIDGDRLLECVVGADVRLRMEVPVGGFAVAGTPIATVAPAGRLDEELKSAILSAFHIGRARSTRHDPEFGLRQIVDVAVKALSPSDNDPTTAVNATEHLGALLVDLAARRPPSPLRRDDRGVVRVVALEPTFARFADLAFDQIRAHGADEPAVLVALLDSIARVAGVVRTEAQRAALEIHVWKVSRAAAANIREPVERELVNTRLARAMERLGVETAAEHYLLPLRAATG